MFKKVRSFLWLLFFLVALFLGAWIAVDNPHPIDFMLFGFSMPQQELGLLMLAVFAAGLLLGLFANIFVMAWMALKLSRLQKRTQKKEEKISPSGRPL